MSAPLNPSFPAYGGSFTAPAYTAVAPRYGQARHPNAEGLLLNSGGNYGNYSYPGAPTGYANFSPRLPNAAAFNGAPASHAYAAPGLSDDAAYHGAPPSHAYIPAFNGGHAYAPLGLPDDAAYHGAPPSHTYIPAFNGGHAYAAPGLSDDAAYHGAPPSHAYAAGFHSTPPTHARGLPSTAGFQDAPRGHARGLNPRARSFEGSGSGGLNLGGTDEEWRQDAGRPLNSGAGQLAGGHLIALSDPTRNPFAREATVRQIWRDNCAEAFEEIKHLVAHQQGVLYIGIDLEYLAHSTTVMNFRPRTPDQWYESLKDFVNNGSVVQLGLAFASEDQDRQIIAYEFNLLVNVDHGNFHQNPIEFLKKNHHDLDRHKMMGILPEWLSAGLLRYLPFSSDRVVWIAYHGDRDFAFLLRLLEGGGRGAYLPSSIDSFLHQFHMKFPVYYDVRVLAQMVKKGYHGKLKTLAGVEYLNLEISGSEHHAGSDALLTLQCFGEILRRYKIEGMTARKGLLSGIEELQLPITCFRKVTASDMKLVQACQENFDREAMFISQTTKNNFNTIGIQMVAPQDQLAIKTDYASLKSAVADVDSFELLISFMNSEGNIAFGRIWKFVIQVQDGDGTRVSPQKLAALLASSGSTHNSNSMWVTYGGEFGLAVLMRSFIAPGDMPPSLVRYKIAKSNFFPDVFDVKTMAEGCEALVCIGGIRETASQLGVVPDDCDVITMLRCFCSLNGIVI